MTMTVTVAKIVEKLLTLPQDSVIYVSAGGYYEADLSFSEIDEGVLIRCL